MICSKYFYIAQTTATLSLSHRIMISGSDATVTFTANCPAEFFCEIDGGGYESCKNFFNIKLYAMCDTGTSPKTYNDLTPGNHTVNIQAMAIKLGRPLRPVTATRRFTIQQQSSKNDIVVN